jgi:hypothetical protein
MMTQDHPSDVMLSAFAAGTLEEAQQIRIAAHVGGCERCRVFVRAMEHVGGIVLDGLPPTSLTSGSLAEVLAGLQEPAASSAASAGAALSGRAAISDPTRGVPHRRLTDWRRITAHSQLNAGLARAALVILVLGITYLAAEYAFFRYADDYAASTSTTGTVVVGGSVVGNIETAGDSDWFRVLLTQGTTYRFHLEGSDTGQGTLQYPVLRLLDDTGRVLLSDSGSVDGPGPGWTSVLSYDALSTGTYYVSSEASGNDIGTYRISVTMY